MKKIVHCNSCNNVFANSLTFHYPHYNNDFLFICYSCHNKINQKLIAISDSKGDFYENRKYLKKLSLIKVNTKFLKKNHLKNNL
jgi:hypothetical protein